MMTLQTLAMILGITVNLGWAGFGMLCGLRWWQERKTRALTANMVNAAIVQLKDAHLTDIKAEAWTEGYQDGKHDQIMEPMIEAGMITPTANPYKQGNE